MQEHSQQQSQIKNTNQAQATSKGISNQSASHIPMFESFNLFCNQNNKAKLLCSSELCNKKCALICRRQNCSCLPCDHANCQLLYAQSLLSSVNGKKKRMSIDVQKAVLQIEKVYQEAINKLSEDRAALLRWKDFYGLTPQEIEFLEVVNSNQRQLITGNLVYKVKKSLLTDIDSRQVQTEKVWLNGQSIQEFWKQGSTDFYRIFKPLTEIVQQYEQDSKSQIKIKQQSRKTKIDTANNLRASENTSVAPNSISQSQPATSYKTNIHVLQRRLKYEPELKFILKPNLTDQFLRKFHFDQQKRQAKKINDEWEQVVSLQQLPKYGKHYFDVQIIDSKSNLAVGIVKQSVKAEQKVYTKKQSIKYFAGGTLWKNGEYTQGGSQIQNGKVIRVTFDIANRNISWWVDGQLVKATKIDQQFLQEKVYASIQTYYRKTKFKIL